jgi:hypothetical protein
MHGWLEYRTVTATGVLLEQSGFLGLCHQKVRVCSFVSCCILKLCVDLWPNEGSGGFVSAAYIYHQWVRLIYSRFQIHQNSLRRYTPVSLLLRICQPYRSPNSLNLPSYMQSLRTRQISSSQPTAKHRYSRYTSLIHPRCYPRFHPSRRLSSVTPSL